MKNGEVEAVTLGATPSPALIAGVLSGLAGLLVFLVLHHLWIQPIWFILPMGLFLAGAGGLAVGWAYDELLPGLPARPWTLPAVVAVIAAILAPSILFAELRAPLFTVTSADPRLAVSVGRAVVVFVLELLLTATVTGGLLGWFIGGSRRAAMATATAGFIFALGPGHNIPFLGNTPGTGTGIALLLAVVLVSAVVLVQGQFFLSRGNGP